MGGEKSFMYSNIFLDRFGKIFTNVRPKNISDRIRSTSSIFEIARIKRIIPKVKLNMRSFSCLYFLTRFRVNLKPYAKIIPITAEIPISSRGLPMDTKSESFV